LVLFEYSVFRLHRTFLALKVIKSNNLVTD